MTRSCGVQWENMIFRFGQPRTHYWYQSRCSNKERLRARFLMLPFPCESPADRSVFRIRKVRSLSSSSSSPPLPPPLPPLPFNVSEAAEETGRLVGFFYLCTFELALTRSLFRPSNRTPPIPTELGVGRRRSLVLQLQRAPSASTPSRRQRPVPCCRWIEERSRQHRCIHVSYSLSLSLSPLPCFSTETECPCLAAEAAAMPPVARRHHCPDADGQDPPTDRPTCASEEASKPRQSLWEEKERLWSVAGCRCCLNRRCRHRRR